MSLAHFFTAATLLFSQDSTSIITQRYVDAPIDAISVGIPSPDLAVNIRGQRKDGTWTAWQTVEPNGEQVASATESDLLLFPQAVQAVEIETTNPNIVLHPIRVSDAPTRYSVAARYQSSQPHILSRNEWGADDSFLFTGKSSSSTEIVEDNSDAPTAPSAPLVESNSRQQKCLDDQKNFPQEFKTSKTVGNEDGKQLRWARQYSKSIKLLVVHHTAMQVDGDNRSGAERMRALYAYHSNNRGWGDIGYNYVIDDQGQIYEGRSGGDYVVAGHAYCDNVGTIGISLMGSFDMENPTQEQVQSLQWLLRQLSDKYSIDAGGHTTFHGASLPTIVGHRDLLSTECPGFYMYGVLDQVRRHVDQDDLSALVTFPIKPTIPEKPRVDRATERRDERAKKLPQVSAFSEGLTPSGSALLQGRPQQQLLFSLRYQAGPNGAKAGQSVGVVTRSDDSIGIWMDRDGAFARVRDAITLPVPVPPGGQVLLRMRVQLPQKTGAAQFTAGSAVYSLSVEGRTLVPKNTPPTFQTTDSVKINPSPIIPRKNISSSSTSSVRSRASSSSSSVSTESPLIRIRLTSRENGLTSCGNANLSTLQQEYRGTVTCQTIDGAPVLINVVSIEDYMLGITEEPDTEPYEKQRAFAIAARTYATYYIDPAHRKFAGKPYDGSDSPAEFQKYTGKKAEAGNPRWIKAVQSTAGMLLTKSNQVIKPPYFSSDDGRTRNPEEAGFGTSFPFAEIFVSKPDPWCSGMELRGHGVGMSGCGAEAQANEGKSAEEILQYYYPGTLLKTAQDLRS